MNNNNLYLFFIIFLIPVFIGITACNANHCFDVLDELPKNEIQEIYFMNFKQISHTHPATDILRCFLNECHSGDISLIAQYFNIFTKCDEYIKTSFEHFGNQQLEELVSLGLPYSLEMYLRAKLETHNKKEVQQAILHVQDVMSKDIELSQDYKNFKYFILQKYKPNN